MDEEMEDSIMFTFTAVEIDVDYEFDAAGYFDFSREESLAEAGSNPREVIHLRRILENVTASPKTKGLENMALPQSGLDIGADPEISAMNINNRGLKFYNHMIDSKPKRNTTAKPSVPRISTLMKPTASQLAKQNKARQVDNSRFLKLENNEKSLTNSSALESQPAKRQKLEGGHLRKVADTNQVTHLVHKEPKKNGTINGNLIHAKLRLTIPKEPALETAHRARRMRSKVSNEQVTSTAPTFRALPLNRRIFEVSSLLLKKRSTPRLPEFQEFHLKTSERALQHNSAVPSSSVHCNDSKVLHQPRAGSLAQCGFKDPRRPNVVDAPKQDGCEMIHKFKALPLNKKIFSSKGDLGVFRNKKRETTVPMEFKFHTERRVQHDPPIELFNKLTLTSELQPSTGSQLKLPRPTCIFEKDSKENKLGAFQREGECTRITNHKKSALVKKLVQAKPPRFELEQIPSLVGVSKIGAMSTTNRSSGIR